MVAEIVMLQVPSRFPPILVLGAAHIITYYFSQNQEFLAPPSPLRQQWSAFGLPPHPPSSAMVSFWLTPLSPPAADVTCERTLNREAITN